MFDVTFYVKAFIALLVLVNPMEGIPVFLAATQGSEPSLRHAIANRAGLVIGIILLVSILLGKAILAFFGISAGAFQIGGGAILFIIAVHLVFGSAESVVKSPPQGGVGMDFAVFPLAIPLMAGPGAITGAILYGTRAGSVLNLGILLVVAVLVAAAAWGSLRLASQMSSHLSETSINIAASITGLIIAAIAIEMIVHGIGAVFGVHISRPPQGG